MEDYTETVEVFNKKEDEITKMLLKSIRELQMLAEKMKNDSSLKRETTNRINLLKYAIGKLKSPIKYTAPNNKKQK